MKLINLYQNYLGIKILPSNRELSTIEKYLNYGRLIEKYFDVELSEMRDSICQIAFNKIGEETGRGYAMRLHKVIQKTIEFARADGMKINDFTLGLEIFAKIEKKEREKKFLHSIKDYQALCEALKKSFNYKCSVASYFLWIDLQTALRPAELMATKWQDINIEKKTLRTYSRISTTKLNRTKPKNRFSVRTIPLNDETVEVFKLLKGLQDEMLEKYNLENPENLVFFHRMYRYNLPTNACLTNYLQQTLAQLNVTPSLCLYGCRHTRISYLLSQGIEIDVLAKYCGHSSIEMIMRTYGGLLDEKRIEGFDAIQKL